MSDDLQFELGKMKVGDRIAMGDTEVLCVPNGWIFYLITDMAITGTFVPNLGIVAPNTKKKSSIVQLQ